MIEEYSNEQKLLDGEVFYKIQYYHLKNDTKLENRQWALLDGSKPKDLKQLLKNFYFAKAFDILVEIQGLWEPIQIKVLHRFLMLKYNKVYCSLFAYRKHQLNKLGTAFQT